MSVFSDFPVGWKMVMATIQGIVIFIGWKMGAPDFVLGIMGSIFGVGQIVKSITDVAKIKANGNGNGKASNAGVEPGGSVVDRTERGAS
jgi:hypothetical protein